MDVMVKICLFFIMISLAGCEKIAILFTPKKEANYSQTQLTFVAEQKFWETLLAGNYDNLPETIQWLTAAYLQNPNDPRLASHLGFSHIWAITERERLKKDDPLIVNEIILAKKYFSDAVELNPQDARYKGFLGDSILVEGQIFSDQREQVHAYFFLKHAIRLWPQFNYFTAGYPMSTLPPQSNQYQEAVAWQWRVLDLCAGARISRKNPDFSPYMKKETQQGLARACWNGTIAPHNFEGFFLNMGDMLVKKGDWQTGIKIYQNAKLSSTYSSWPYRHLLEYRILHAQENVKSFQQQTTHSPLTTILFNSGYGCVVCHQAK